MPEEDILPLKNVNLLLFRKLRFAGVNMPLACLKGRRKKAEKKEKKAESATELTALTLVQLAPETLLHEIVETVAQRLQLHLVDDFVDEGVL